MERGPDENLCGAVLADGESRLEGEIMSLQGRRIELVKDLKCGTGNLCEAVSGMRSGFREDLSRIARDGKAERLAFLAGLKTFVSDLREKVIDMRQDFAADIQGARRAWSGISGGGATAVVEKLRQEQAERRKAEAERRAREEAARKVKEEAERKTREEAERKTREEAERRAREEAARKVKEEAERKTREEAERKTREEAAHGVQSGAEHNEGKAKEIDRITAFLSTKDQGATIQEIVDYMEVSRRNVLPLLKRLVKEDKLDELYGRYYPKRSE